MKQYTESTLNSFTKNELIKHCICLQQNLANEEYLNNHMYNTIIQAMHDNPTLSEEIVRILAIWNKSAGFRYEER